MSFVNHCAAGLLAALLPLAAQTPNGPQVVIRSTTRMVQVNVVAQDRNGRPVQGLTKEDFQVADGGKKQQIAFFSVESKDKPRPPVAPLPPNVFSNRVEQRSGAPTSITIILLDGLNTRWGDQMTATGHLVGFLGQIQPGDRVALFGLARDLRILHDYTSDTSALVETLNAWKGTHAGLLQASQQIAERQPYNNSPAMAPASAKPAFTAESPSGVIHGVMDLLEEEANYAEEMRIKTTLKALEAIANHVATIPGRKNLVWVSAAFPLTMGFLAGKEASLRSSAPGNAAGKPPSDGGRPMPRSQTRAVEMEDDHMKHVFGRNPTAFDMELTRAVKALNNANLAVYPVDARGLTTDPGAATNIGTMRDIASRTGGRAYYNRNDLQNAIREAVADSSVTYTLAYYPSEQKGNGEFRGIKVKVNRPGLTLHHRKGYFDVGEAAPADAAAREAALADALWSPLDATSVVLEARVNPGADGRLSVDAVIDAGSLSLTQRNGGWHGAVDVLMVQTDSKGNGLDPASRTVRIDATEETYRHAQKAGFVFHRDITRLPGATGLRIVLRDVPSGNLGSVSIPFAQLAGATSRK